jgi:hypothetical protein
MPLADAVIICARVGSKYARPEPGCDTNDCQICNAPIWIAPRTRNLIKEAVASSVEVRLLCNECAKVEMKKVQDGTHEKIDDFKIGVLPHQTKEGVARTFKRVMADEPEYLGKPDTDVLTGDSKSYIRCHVALAMTIPEAKEFALEQGGQGCVEAMIIAGNELSIDGRLNPDQLDVLANLKDAQAQAAQLVDRIIAGEDDGT